MKILVTGSCGFIGTNLCITLLDQNHQVYGIDNFIDNYNVDFKRENLQELIQYDNFTFFEEDILGTDKYGKILPDKIIHLASIPGIRKSLQDPLFYAKNNIIAFIYLLEECKKHNIREVIYASSSSVYGANKKVPFNENDEITSLCSSYACSKKCMEVYGKYYNDIFGIKIIGVRFFTVYGERGRPDMAPYIFVKNIAEGNQIFQFGDGSSYRDYTYVGDIVQGLVSLLNGNGRAGEIYNLGNESPINLLEFIKLCELVTGKKAIKKIIENQLGDVPRTYADITKSKIDLNYSPQTNLTEGLHKMYEWMIENNRITLHTHSQSAQEASL